MKSNSRWKNHDVWLCLNHLPAVRYRAGQDDCWYAGCKTKRPDEAGRPEKSEEAPPPPRPRPRARPRRPVVRPAVAPTPAVVAEAPAAAPVAAKVTTPVPASSNASLDEDGEDVTEAEVDFDPEEKCAWPPCTKKKRPRSKYCSRNCSNKFARWRHRQRQKAKDE